VAAESVRHGLTGIGAGPGPVDALGLRPVQGVEGGGRS
jgi:hypothetical protein